MNLIRLVFLGFLFFFPAFGKEYPEIKTELHCDDALSDSRMHITAFFNGHKGNLLIDTGGTSTLLSTTFLKQHKIPYLETHHAGFSAIAETPVRIGSVKLSWDTATDEIVSLDFPANLQFAEAGILVPQFTFAGNYVVIDCLNHIFSVLPVTLGRQWIARHYGNWNRLELDRIPINQFNSEVDASVSPIIVLASLDRQMPRPVILDSGTPNTLFSKAAFPPGQIFEDGTKEWLDINGGMHRGKVAKNRIVKIDNVSIGPLDVGEEDVFKENIPGISGALGYDILHRYAIILSPFADRKVFLFYPRQ